MTRWIFAAGLIAVSFALPAAESDTSVAGSRTAPGFELPAIDGSVYRLSDFRGRYLLVNFWAVWCSPCRLEMPSMQRAYQRLKSDGFDMIAIHVGPSLDNAKRYAQELGLTFPILVDADMDLGSWQVTGLPTTYLVDPQGNIIAEAVGEREWDDPKVIERLQTLMQDG